MQSATIKILLVEDNPGDARLIQEYLSELDRPFEMVHADRLAEAVARLSGESFDLVLLDLSLPDSHGLKTLAGLRSHFENVPVVILTGLDDEGIALSAVEQGAQDYLIKGQVDANLLFRTVRHSIQRHRAEESLKDRNRELMILKGVSEMLLGSLDLNSVLDRILEQTMSCLTFDLGNIRLLDSSGDILKVTASRGYNNPDNARRHRELSHRLDGALSRFGQRLLREPCVRENVQAQPGFRTLKKEGIDAFVFIPIRADGEVIGIIQVGSRTPRRFGQEEINLLATIGNQTGVAVRKAQLFERSCRQAVELEEARKLQADFTAMIAHDLRSPLMNITGTAEVMIEGIFGPVTDDQSKWLFKILESGRGLVQLVNDFLDLSKLEAGCLDINKQPLVLRELIPNNLDNHVFLAQRKNITIRHSVEVDLPSIQADPRRVDQVLNNLVNNAIKFSDGGEIQVGAKVKSPFEVLVWVKDNGIGISVTDLPVLFQKYRQCGNRLQSGEAGTGLGLVISKMIVEAHCGRIWAESEPGKGSTFYFSLPIGESNYVAEAVG